MPVNAVIDASYIREWFVEDPKRYERLAMRPVRSQKVPNPGTNIDQQVYDTIISIVLEVPRAKTESVTNQLRGGTASPANYLGQAAAHAEDAATLRDEVVTLDLEKKALLQLVSDLASHLDDYDNRIEKTSHLLDDDLWTYFKRGRPKNVGTRWRDLTAKALQDITLQSRGETNKMKAALTERRTDVAAKLLSAMPDDD